MLAKTLTHTPFLSKTLDWQSWINTLPIYTLLGVFAYFAYPAVNLIGFICVVSCICGLIISLKQHRLWRIVMLMILGVVIGWGWTALHVNTSKTKILSKQYRYTTISGTVADVNAVTHRNMRIILSGIQGDALQPQDLGTNIRLTLRNPPPHIRPGDQLSMKATIFPPSRPSYPGSFDFGRFFFFRDIGGVGYSTGGMTLTPAQASHVMPNVFDAWRQSLQSYLLDTLNQPEAGIAVALTTGSKTAIERSTREAMTTSGLAHMLAISGMHMAIVCGLLYVSMRYLLAAIPYIALRYPIKQYAACFGLISGMCYLALADFPVSAIRAYIMVSLMFGAILFHREADALRSLVLAALFLFIINPVSVTEIGFQLSFSATLALILTYRRWHVVNNQLKQRITYRILRIPIYILEAGLTSFIATMATAPLMMYYFNHIAPYSLISNMLALPILSFWVVPSLICSLLIAPIGLEHYTLTFASIGIGFITDIAQWTSALPHATFHIPTPHPLAVCIMLLMCIAMISTKSLRHAAYYAIICVLSVISAWHWMPMPDMLISGDRTAIAVRQDENSWLLLKGTHRNFHVEQWQERTGHIFSTYKKATNTTWKCNTDGCDGRLDKRNIRIRFDYKAQGELCLPTSDIVISTFYSDRWSCDSPDALRIDRSILEKYGTQAISFRGKETISVWHNCQKRHSFIWQRCNT